MAGKFDIPFADDGTHRNPTASERATGFPCGPADATLFNGLFHAIHAELGHLIDFAGLTDNADDLQQVRKAIEALIATALGSLGEGEDPDLSGFLLLGQARSRLPIFPIIQTSDNRMVVSQPGGGSILVPPTVTVLHRGIYPLSTSDFTEPQRTFATAANKTYHVRLNLAAGVEALTLEDLADSGYNPSVLAETHSDFDSTYDDMLIARVVTNGSNVATITNLRNADKLDDDITGSGTPTGSGNDPPIFDATINYNWARRPRIWSELHGVAVRPITAPGPGSTIFAASDVHDHDESYSFISRDRYGCVFRMSRDYSHSFSYRMMVLA